MKRFQTLALTGSLAALGGGLSCSDTDESPASSSSAGADGATGGAGGSSDAGGAASTAGSPGGAAGGPSAPVGFLLQICRNLVERGSIDVCGTEPEQCESSGDGGCLQLGGADIVLRGGSGSIGPETTDPALDVAGLLDRLPFVAQSDKENLPSTGPVIIGDPAAEGEVYVEIDPDAATFEATDGQISAAGGASGGPFDGAYYQRSVEELFPVMGIAEAQVLSEVSGVVGEDSDGTSTLMSRTVVVVRVVNGIQVSRNELRFDFHPENGELAGISGTWTRVDYTSSQFELDASVQDTASALVARFEELKIDPSALQGVLLYPYYRIDEDSRALDLVLCIVKGNLILEMDI